jgi:hypothetical protein
MAASFSLVIRMEKKTIIIAVATIFVVGIMLVWLISVAPSKEVEPTYFTDSPESWIEDDRDSDDPNAVKINVYRATKTLSFFDSGKQEYFFYGKRVVFFTHGYYQGNYFDQAYIFPDKAELSANMSYEKMMDFLEKNSAIKIGPEMDPNDGVMNAFILGRVEDREFVFYIYLDEDWKRQMPTTYMMWGDDLSNPGKVVLRQFSFRKSNDGIYVEKVEGLGWYGLGTNGGIIVGEIGKDALLLKSEKDLNATFIYVK